MRLAILAGLFALCPVSASAAIEVFDASGTFEDGGLLSGTVSIDTRAGKVTAADVFLTNALAPFEASVLEFSGKQVGVFQNFYFIQIAHDRSLNQYMNLLIKTDLVNYNGGIIAGAQKPAPGGFFSEYLESGIPGVALSSGTLSRPMSGVPEPVAWTLMMMGVGVAGAVKRRRSLVALHYV